ncbi:conserved hypothetical protein [Hyphomicrobiales bacterium]|nr:conserved hypothetical protein [Hyphomicrobiales bacterium]CAH1663968.1 conserved hypothetical protein [Hyphomicrobiales bacterium]
MADRPILFSAPMVRALLEDSKTQTRRFLAPWCDEPPAFVDSGAITAYDEDDSPYRWPRTHAIGDRLWVKEAWRAARGLNNKPPRRIPPDADIEYAATAPSYAEIGIKGKLRPSIFMPRWASRITLIVSDVRVQWLRDISEEDAIAEGIFERSAIGDDPMHDTWTWRREGWRYSTPQMAYAALWTEINGPGAWDANPWVAAYTFTAHRCNIDQMEAEHAG